MSEDISNRQRRYLYMMGFRAAMFGVAVVLFVYGYRWEAFFPAVCAIVIPYFAVVYANSGREPDNTRGFMEYRPNLPERRDPEGQGPNGHGPGAPGQPGGWHGSAGEGGPSEGGQPPGGRSGEQ